MKVPCSVEAKTMVLVDKNEIQKILGNSNDNRENHNDYDRDTSCADDNYSSSTSIQNCSLLDTECSESISSLSRSEKSIRFKGENSFYSTQPSSSSSVSSFTSLRLNYLTVNLVIMLADGLQGVYCSI